MQHAAITQGIQMAALVHDLKAPMTIAAGAAQLALQADGKDVSAQLHQILQAMGAMDRMLSMMGEEQTEAGECAFTGAQLGNELAAMTGARAAQKGQSLSIDLSALGSGVFCADYAALCRLLMNLLGNAVKYTQSGGTITLRAQMERTWRQEYCRVRFVVADNGPGMSKGFMKRMYLPYARARETQSQPGKGLGLASARDMARRLGATIRVHSEMGIGTTFAVNVTVRKRLVN